MGIINVNVNLKSLIERWAKFVQNLTEEKYGFSPAIRISGHVNARYVR